MLHVTLYSDFTCPYCYLVERSSLPRLGADFGGIEIDWQPFEVEPSGPPAGVPPVASWYEAFALRAAELARGGDPAEVNRAIETVFGVKVDA